ncbi:MAG: family 10 glycosylhydrolase [Casimicrobium sp.]
MWIATVGNIDWPSKRGLSADQQRAEMRKIVEAARRLKLNALVLQVRPSADAIYPSKLEPWTEYLSGTQGVATAANYDPLAEWIQLAHAEGLELHAWFNPYRARHNTATSAPAANHVSNSLPRTVKTYGNMQWMDPGEPDAARHTLAVIADVVRRYDIDGVHLDDYFYPYPVKVPPVMAANGTVLTKAEELPDLDFPDEPSWQRYKKEGGKMARADWRRDNINRLVKTLYREVHAAKPWVKVGISPFGLPKPDRRPAGITGFSQYDKLYADVEHWFEQGWLDYLAPQLYWPIAQEAQAFPALLRYWASINKQSRHLWPGLFTSRIDASDKSWLPDEIVRQIALVRNQSGATGHIHFSAAALVQNRRGISDALAASMYAKEARIPETPWLVSRPPVCFAPVTTPIESPANVSAGLR